MSITDNMTKEGRKEYWENRLEELNESNEEGRLCLGMQLVLIMSILLQVRQILEKVKMDLFF